MSSSSRDSSFWDHAGIVFMSVSCVGFGYQLGRLVALRQQAAQMKLVANAVAETMVAQRNGTDVMKTAAGRQLAGYLLGIVARHPEAQARVDAMEEKE